MQATLAHPTWTISTLFVFYLLFPFILQDLSPWNFPSANCIKSTTETNPNIWASKTDRSSFLLILVILYTAVNSTCDLKLPYINVHTQLFLSHLQLTVLLGLTKDKGESLLARLCTGRLCQFLGKYSMAIYMLHDPVIKILILHARLPQELVSTQMLSIILTLLVSVLITHLVEKPIYKVTYHRWGAEDSSVQPKDLTNQCGIKLI